MHEYSLMKDVIDVILKQLEENPLKSNEAVKEISFSIGALDIHSEESFKQAFVNLILETPLKGSKLNLTIVPGHLKCDKCGFDKPCPLDSGDGHEAMPVAECPGCGHLIHIQGGRGITNIQLKVE